MDPLIVKPGEGRPISPIGKDLSFFKALGAQTGGSFALLEQTVPPGHGPRRHVHRREEESFYILEGEFGFEVGETSFIAGPGTFVLVPPGVEHGFANRTAEPVRMLNIHAPGGFDQRVGID